MGQLLLAEWFELHTANRRRPLLLTLCFLFPLVRAGQKKEGSSAKLITAPAPLHCRGHILPLWRNCCWCQCTWRSVTLRCWAGEIHLPPPPPPPQHRAMLGLCSTQRAPLPPEGLLHTAECSLEGERLLVFYSCQLCGVCMVSQALIACGSAVGYLCFSVF